VPLNFPCLHISTLHCFGASTARKRSDRWPTQPITRSTWVTSMDHLPDFCERQRKAAGLVGLQKDGDLLSRLKTREMRRSVFRICLIVVWDSDQHASGWINRYRAALNDLPAPEGAL
jgi:hypothetical protein